MCFIFMFFIFSIIPNSSDAVSFLTKLNSNQSFDGRLIIEGDIILPQGKKSNDRKGHNILWPNGQVYYCFHSSVNDEVKEIVVRATKEWENQTCLQFTDTGKPVDFHFILVRTDSNRCSSHVGYDKSKAFQGQDLTLAEGCEKGFNVVLHELGHAIGFHHEQSRSDRNGFIHVNRHNIRSDEKFEFNLERDNPRGIEYDYTSIMHYDPGEFSAKPKRKNTMTSLNPLNHHLVGSGKIISFRDAKLANLMYNCNNDCPNKNKIQCLNGGYLSPYRKDGANCTCVCPPNTSGKLCENANQPLEYYDRLPCGGSIAEETFIQTPGYPTRKLSPDPCSWWIQAPKGKSVQVEFLDFSFHPRIYIKKNIKEYKEYHKTCNEERVELRIFDRYDGDMYCGDEIPPGSVFRSSGEEFIIIIETKKRAQFGRGLKAKISFVDQDSQEKSENAPLTFLPVN